MVTVPIPIATGFYENRSLVIAAQECVNWQPGVVEGPGLSQEVLFGTPGLDQLATSGAIGEVNRGSHVMNKIAYFVNGTTLYRLTRTVVDDVDSFALDILGTIPGTARVSMADNGTQLCILVSGGTVIGGVDAFIWVEDTTTFTQITDADFLANGAPQQVDYIDSFFVFTTDSKKFIISALNDGLAYDALDFGTAEADPDDIVTLIVHSNQLFIGGSETIEAFQNIGGGGFPFQRVEGFVLPTGVRAAFSMIEAADTFFFIGGGSEEGPTIRRFTGSATEIVSSDGIDSILESFTDSEIEEAFAFSYSQGGGRFVGFAFPTTTLVFDAVNSRWHERKSRITAGDGSVDTLRWRVNSLVQAYGRILVGDSEDGRIGQVDLDFFDEYDSEIIRTFATLAVSNNGQAFMVPSIELTMESGVGDTETEDPEIRMQFSNDAKKFSNPITRKIGRIGDNIHRIIWRKLGRFARFAVFRFTMSDKVKAVAIKLEADIVGGI